MKTEPIAEEFEVCARPVEKLERAAPRETYWHRMLAALHDLDVDRGECIKVKFSEIPKSAYMAGMRHYMKWGKVSQRLRPLMVKAGWWDDGWRPKHSWSPDEQYLYIWLERKA